MEDFGLDSKNMLDVVACIYDPSAPKGDKDRIPRSSLIASLVCILADKRPCTKQMEGKEWHPSKVVFALIHMSM